MRFNDADYPRISHGLVLAHRYTEKTKALQLQTRTAYAGGETDAQSLAYSDSFAGTWCLVAPPAAPTLDTLGNVESACEALVAEEGDDLTVLGQRDVRWSKFAQDARPGEAVLINAFGSRLKIGEKKVTLTGGGAFLSFDVENKKVGLAGYPTTKGNAPYLSIEGESIGLVSATGQSSVAVSGNQATVSGAAFAADVGSVALGKGAVDPVVTVSTLQPILSALYATLATLMTATATGTPPPIIATARGSSSVKAKP